jgi:hypothetical protein
MPKKNEAKALTRQLIAAPKAEVDAEEKAFREKVKNAKASRRAVHHGVICGIH